MNLLRITVAVLLAVLVLPLQADEPGYVGAETCGSCHAEAFSDWQKSHHFHAMQPADEASVLGNFDDAVLEVGDVVSRFRRDGGRFLVDTLAGEGIKTLTVRYTFGFSPLQQYLVETNGGRLQALNLAWDSRPADAGGQRWFHLRDEFNTDSPFYWTAHFQNWNSRCADCHSTGVRKNFDESSDSYATTFTDVNVACEACHGPGRAHLQAVTAGNENLAIRTTSRPIDWKFAGDDPIASPRHPEPLLPSAFLDMCGGCHSRRSLIDDAAGSYHDRYRLSLIDPGLYLPDGRIEDEVFVLGSFLQSRMHARGVTCMNCHNAHSGALKIEGNGLCAQCHAAARYEAKSHRLHVSGSGSACVDCHMPARTYMKVDDRRDHSFSVPDPGLTIRYGIPNACNDCHRDRTAAWALGNIGRTVAQNAFAELNTLLENQDPLLVPTALVYISDEQAPPVRRATLLSRLPITPDSVEAAIGLLSHASPLIRYGAVRHLSGYPSAGALLHESGLSDGSALVRSEAAKAILTNRSGHQPAGPGADKLLMAYRASLAQTVDTPSTQTELALLEWAKGDVDTARAHFRRALAIEPQYLPALLNLADLERQAGADDEASRLLFHAVEIAPDSAAACFSHGLSLVRQGRKEDAVDWLGRAVNLGDSTPRYAYVFAVALDAVGLTQQAVRELGRASNRWPNQYDLLVLEVAFREKARMIDGIEGPVKALGIYAGSDPRIKTWQARYLQD